MARSLPAKNREALVTQLIALMDGIYAIPATVAEPDGAKALIDAVDALIGAEVHSPRSARSAVGWRQTIPRIVRPTVAGHVGAGGLPSYRVVQVPGVGADWVHVLSAPGCYHRKLTYRTREGEKPLWIH